MRLPKAWTSHAFLVVGALFSSGPHLLSPLVSEIYSLSTKLQMPMLPWEHPSLPCLPRLGPPSPVGL